MAVPLMYYGMLLMLASGGVGIVSAQVFSTHPVNSTVLQSGIADFRCRLNGFYPCKNIHWVKYVGTGNVRYRTKKYISSCVALTDRKYFDETRYSVTKQNINEFRLEIRDIRPSDAGAYGCVYKDVGGSINRPSAISSLIVLNSWPTPNCGVIPRNPAVGQAVRFTCTPPPGSPTLPLTWTYRKSAEFGGTKTVHPGQSFDLVWRLGTTENYEYFTCFSGHGNAVKACTVSPLKIPPTPIVSPVIVRKHAGDNAEFKCQVVITTPSIKSRVWFVVDGEQKLRRFYNSSGRYRVLDDNASFRIKHITERDNNTHVWCTAKNDRGVYSEATGTARLLVLSQGSHVIRNPVVNTMDMHDNMYDVVDKTSSMDDISASNATNGPRGHSAAVAGGTAAAIFLVVVVIALWIYLLKGRLKSMRKKIRGKPYSKSGSYPLPVLTTDNTYQRGCEMRPYNPPDVTKVSILPPSTSTLVSRQQRDIDDIVVYALPFPKGSGTLPYRSSQHYHSKTQTLPARHGRSRKTHTVCMTYQDAGPRGSSLPTTPLLPRRSARRRGTAATGDVKLDFRDRQASFIPASHHRSRGRTSCRIPMQAPVMSQCATDYRASSLPNSPQTVRASRRRHTKDEVVFYALPLQNDSGTLRMKSSSSTNDIPRNEATESVSKKRSRFGSTISKGKKRSLVSSLSLSELRFGTRKSFKLSEDQRRRKNVEGLVYADLELSTSSSSSEKEAIIGENDKTVYADIKGINMEL